MADMLQGEEDSRTFRERFQLTMVDLNIAVSPESVSHVFSAANVTVAKNLLLDLVRILALQTQPNIRTVASQNDHTNHLENLISIGLSVPSDRFDIGLAIPLIEEVVNNGPEEKVRSAVSRLAARARLLLTSLAPSLKVAPDAQFPASNQVTESMYSTIADEPEIRATKGVKLAPPREKDCIIGIGREYDLGTTIRDNTHYDPAPKEPPMFEYRPLNAARREIRLLVLHPSTDMLDFFTYTCSLIYVSMDEDPDYEALSYVWGSEGNKQKILIDGRQLSVTLNLAEALDHLHDSHRTRKLWVDAICINQKDIPERNQQVLCMTEIYARARNVVVWIGLLGRPTLDLLHRLEDQTPEDQTQEHLKGWTASGSRIKGDPSGMNEEDKRLLSELARNPWFGRVWVIQEVAVAREVIVQAGRTTICWSVFSAALEKCINNLEMKSIIEAVDTINTIRSARSQEPYEMDLFVLLERFRHCLATDERDKVFALLGLTSTSLAQEKVVQVIPDYSKPAVDVYRSLARQYINKRKNLDIICHATLSNHMPIPSWVPSWSWHNKGLSVLPKRRISGTGHETMYRCCGDMEIDRDLLFGTDLSSNRLWLNGYKFDVVSIVGSVATKVQDLGLEVPVNGLTNLMKEWTSMSEICSHSYGPNLEEAFRRTLLGDAVGEKRWQETTHPAVIEKETDKDALSNGSKGANSTDFVYLVEGRLGSVEREKDNSLAARLNSRIEVSEASMKRAAIKRAFFTTERGYMGLGPENMEEGDLIYILSGGQVPFILRPTILTEGFSLVGESYIHGIMDGEATVLGMEIETIFLM
ncbi:heterokaryon incompatibility protein-domain-containing protein [Rhexocercosporidium sp. MPI-PUGE-AT-0058]|nr:heterokaryon incompatibility protein-domain-containing protein [Rhexocercosporidium sp. MPI-PUGE-AT-0058]